jgi:hypothetical protein
MLERVEKYSDYRFLFTWHVPFPFEYTEFKIRFFDKMADL